MVNTARIQIENHTYYFFLCFLCAPSLWSHLKKKKKKKIKTSEFPCMRIYFFCSLLFLFGHISCSGLFTFPSFHGNNNGYQCFLLLFLKVLFFSTLQTISRTIRLVKKELFLPHMNNLPFSLEIGKEATGLFRLMLTNYLRHFPLNNGS